MNAWKTWDRIFNRISWTVLGVYIAYELGVRFALPADAVAGIDRYADWLIPVLLICRPFKGIFTNGTKIKKELHTLFKK